MGTPNKQNNLLVKTPKYSIFDISSDHKLTMSMGKIVPLNEGYELNPGDEIDINLQQLTRFMPMISPVMQRYILDYIPVFVPFRLLWSEEAPIFNSNKYFNPATLDSERPAIPMTSARQLLKNTTNSVISSLFDYLGYPTFTGIYTSMINGRINSYDVQPSVTTGEGIDSLFVWDNNPTSADEPNNLCFKYLGSLYNFDLSTVTSHAEPYDFRTWLIKYKGCNVVGVHDFETMVKQIPGSVKFANVQDEYLNYLFLACIDKVYPSNGAKDLSLLPWLCYWKAVLDWFVRTDMVDQDTTLGYLKTIANKLVTANTTLGEMSNTYTGTFTKQLISGQPATRLWMDDYFTTGLNYLSTDHVPIPVSGSISDFWRANRMEQFFMRRKLAGKRFMDQIFQLFGVKVPDSRLQRTEVLGHLKFNIVVSDVLQTSQSDIDSSLGQFAGQGLSSNGAHLLHYKADEPGMILILCSVRPTSSYVDRVPRLILRKDYYDFCNPTFDNVGTQTIYNNELCYVPGDVSQFGLSPRRYSEYMTGFSSIHGLFKTSLDYWHAGRKFNLETSRPSLNQAFIQMDDADSLDRIFASQTGDNILSQVYLDARVTRPLSRYINYHM